MVESIIHPEPSLRDFDIFHIIMLQTDLNTSSMSLSLKIVSAFEVE